MSKDTKFEAIIDREERGISASEFLRGLIGMSVEELVRDILENKGGKYDEIFIKEAEAR